MEGVYAHFGLPFSGAAADAIRGFVTHGTASRGFGSFGGFGSRSAHQYTLADFGLTAAGVGARFGAFGHRGAELR